MSRSLELQVPEPVRPGRLRRAWALAPAAIVGLLVLGFMALVIVPGNRPDDRFGLTYGSYCHGWPCVYLERSGSERSWELTADVYWWSPLRLAVDVLCALAIAGAVVLVFERCRRRPRRFAIGLRGMLVGVAIVSVLMLLAGRWHQRHEEMARVAARAGTQLFPACPAWLVDVVDRLGYEPDEVLPNVLLELGMDGVLLDQIDADTVEIYEEELSQLRERMAIKPELAFVRLTLDNETDPDALAQQLQVVSDLRSLEIVASRDAISLFPRVFTQLPRLESLRILSRPTHNGGQDDRVDPAVVKAAIRALPAENHLRMLVLSATGLTRADFESISNLQQLELVAFLVHSPDSFDVELLSSFKRLPRLRTLAIQVPSYPDWHSDLAGLEVLADFPALECLSLVNCNVAEQDVAAIARIRSLRRLDFNSSRISHSALDRLATLPPLREFLIGGLEFGVEDSFQLSPAVPSTTAERPIATQIRELMPGSGVIE